MSKKKMLLNLGLVALFITGCSSSSTIEPRELRLKKAVVNLIKERKNEKFYMKESTYNYVKDDNNED